MNVHALRGAFGGGLAANHGRAAGASKMRQVRERCAALQLMKERCPHYARCTKKNNGYTFNENQWLRASRSRWRKDNSFILKVKQQKP